MDPDHKSRCYLLVLPAELRLKIYEAVLAPIGTIKLMSTRSKRFATEPILAPALLRTCRQIHSEAEPILYGENSICLKVDAHDTCSPSIAERRLPQHVLEKLQHMSVTLDCASNFYARYLEVDWAPFSALVSLKTLRLAMLTCKVEFPRYDNLSDQVHALLPEVLERIPASAKVIYGDIESRPVESRFSHRAGAEVRRRRAVDRWAVQEVDATQLAKLAAEVGKNIVQGYKSGSAENVYAEYHDQFHKQ